MTRIEGAISINPVDGAEMVLIPAGAFALGSTDEAIAAIVAQNPQLNAKSFAQERPRRVQVLPEFWMYRYPVTVAQFRAHCLATGRAMPPEPEWGWQDDHPVVNVSWDDANGYATWANAVLPPEAQWEKAARGNDERLWPWGNTWEPDNCAWAGNAKTTMPVGSYPAGASPYGLLDMAGNVWEWCHAAAPGSYERPATRESAMGRASTSSGHVLRGGAWRCAFEAYLRCAYRCFDCDQRRGYSAYRRPACGFRCMVSNS